MEKETYGPTVLHRDDGTRLVLVPKTKTCFGVYMIGNPCYNLADEIIDRMIENDGK